MSRFALTLSRGIARVTEAALGPHQAAVIRIGFAGTWLLFLLREFPHRRELYGPDGPWNLDMARQLTADNHAFSALLWSDGQAWFEVCYLFAVLASVLLLLGWRSRTSSVLFMIGVLSLQNRSIFMGDGGDNVLHLMCIYLVFTRCGQVWSLDARRAVRVRVAAARGERVVDRAGPALWAVLGTALAAATLTGRFQDWLVPALLWAVWAAVGLWWLVARVARSADPRILLDVIANLLHNGAMAVIMAEACLIYATAGWYKIQGERWQDGTAVYYPLHLDYFSPWPGLADLLSANGTAVMLITYGTVVMQVAFPFTLFNRRVKNVLLVGMMTEHAVIAVVLGLPFFSLAMIAADAVFLPTVFLLRLEGLAVRARGRLLPARAGGGTLPGPRSPEDGCPGPHGHPEAGPPGAGRPGDRFSQDQAPEDQAFEARPSTDRPSATRPSEARPSEDRASEDRASEGGGSGRVGFPA